MIVWIYTFIECKLANTAPVELLLVEKVVCQREPHLLVQGEIQDT